MRHSIAMPASRLPARQRGIALAVALILLVVLTLLALSGIRLSTMELRMALNDELRVAAFEQAQSMVDGTVRRFTNTPILAPGVTRCAKVIPDKCTTATLVLPTSGDAYGLDAQVADTSVDVNVLIERIPPQNAEPPVNSGFSLSSFDAAYMQVAGLWDKNAAGLGSAIVREGIAIVYGSAGDITTTSGADTFNRSEDPDAAPADPCSEPGVC
jgi:hypothetical protein